MHSVRGMLVLAISGFAFGFVSKFAMSLSKSAAQFPSDDVKKELKKVPEGTGELRWRWIVTVPSLLSYSAKEVLNWVSVEPSCQKKV